MSVLSHSFQPTLLDQAASFLRRSRSLSSMLPALLLSGVITLLITAVMHVMWSDMAGASLSAWMESWLTAWPIAFPVTYLLGPSLFTLAARASAPAPVMPLKHEPGLGFDDILSVSACVTSRHRHAVLRNLKPLYDFKA